MAFGDHVLVVFAGKGGDPVACCLAAGTRRRSPALSAATRPPQTPCWPMSQRCSDSVRQWPRTGQAVQTAIAVAASWRA